MAATASSDASEGPVLSLINKRLRALRKKLNRISQMEESISQGKTLLKEQQELLRSKPSITILIDELEKLRTPLSAAVTEEINLATKHIQTAPDGAKLEDLVNLLYFGCLFDVKSQNEFTSVMLTRTHERGCCLSYDYVTDDTTDLLGDKDLDSISKLWSMMVSRPVDSCLSHKNALERCIEHAKLWLGNSDQAIESDGNVSYALLREKLKKIMGSDYFTTSPEIKAPVDLAAAAAAAAGNYGSFQVIDETQGSGGQDYQQKEEDEADSKVLESGVSDHFEHQKDESVKGEVLNGQEEQDYSQVGAKNVKREYEQQYVPRGTYQNQRGDQGGRRGGRRGYSNGRGGRGGGGGYQNGGRYYDSYDQSGGNGYQRNYYNNRGGRGRNGGVGGGGGNGHSYNNHHDSNFGPAT